MVHMPIFGHMFFGYASAIFGQIGLKFSMGVQETTTINWATFGGKMGVVTTQDANGLGSQNKPKSCQLGGPFGSTDISLKSVFT